MRYIVCKGRYYIARTLIDRYTARDYWLPVYIEYGGRVTASASLVFDTKEAAQLYIDRNNINGAEVTAYNIGCNCIAKEA